MLNTEPYDGTVEIVVIGSDSSTRYGTWSSFVTLQADNPKAHTPEVSIVSPRDGKNVNRLVPIKVKAYSKNRITAVEIRINGGKWEEAGYDGTYYVWEWDAAALGKATSSIEARAWDDQGNVGLSSTHYVRSRGGVQSKVTVERQDRAMWIWEHASYNLVLNPGSRQVLAAMAKDTETFSQDAITTLYLGVDRYQGMDMLEDEREKVREFIRWAHAEGFRVEGLIAGGTRPPYFGAYARYQDHAVRELEKIINYNLASEPEARFDGVNVDVEPYIAKDFKTEKPSLQIAYLELLEKLMQRQDASGLDLPIGPAIPRWYDTSQHAQDIPWKGEIKPLNEHIQDMVDYIAIMDYRDQAEGSVGIIQQAQRELDYANELGKKNAVVIGVETKDIADGGDPEMISFREEGRSFMEAELDKVYEAFADNEAFAGVALHHYDEIRALPSKWGPDAVFWEPPADEEPPSSLQHGVTATAFDHQTIELTYGRAYDNTEVQGYHIYRGTSPEFEADEAHRVGIARGLSFTDKGLLPDTEYFYKVAAMDVQGHEGPVTGVASAVTGSTELKPLIVSGMDMAYEEGRGKVTVSVSELATGEPVPALIHGRFTYTAGRYVDVQADASGIMTASSETIPFASGQVGFQVNRIAAAGYYWASAYDEPGQSTAVWGVNTQETIPVAADTFVRGGSHADENYGAEAVVEVKNAPGSEEYDRIGLFQFNLEPYNGGNVQRASLFFYVTRGVTDSEVSKVPIEIHTLADDSWSENSMTWNELSANASAALSATVEITSAGWYSVDVTEAVAGDLEDGAITFRLSDSTGVDRMVSVASKESGDSGAYLVLQ